MDLKPSYHLRPITPSQQLILSEIQEHKSSNASQQSVSGSLRSDWVDIDSENEYDTDIESEERNGTDYDDSGVKTYKKTCRKLRQTAVRQVLNGLEKDKITLKNRGLSTEAVLAISNSLLVNITVTELCLDGNNINSKSLKYLSWMLSDNTNITTLSLRENDFDTSGIQELCTTLQNNSTLTYICLSGNNLNDHDCALIKDVLLVNTNLLHLDLSYNNITDDGAALISEAISANDYIKSINLSWNKIRPNGAVHIANSLKENVMLKSLKLAMNGLSIHGCNALSQALLQNDSLTLLDISHTRMNDQEALYLIPLLAKNETLQSLTLAHNTISTRTICTYLETIRNNENSSLTLLDMTGIPIMSSVLFFQKLLRENRPEFKFLHGDLLTYTGNLDTEEAEMLSRYDPLKVVRWYISLRRIPVKQLLSPEGAEEVVKPQLSMTLKQHGLKLTEKQLDLLYKTADGSRLETLNVNRLTAVRSQ